jgi:phospholipid/cholesterol/gamma-HCH transport system substrate-binding protein
MKPHSIDFLVGLFVLLGLGALTALALKTANLTAFLGSFSNNNTYILKAEFDNIGSLKPNAPVKTAGVVIGRVSKIELNPKTLKAVTTLDIEKKYVLNEDVSIKIDQKHAPMKKAKKNQRQSLVQEERLTKFNQRLS